MRIRAISRLTQSWGAVAVLCGATAGIAGAAGLPDLGDDGGQWKTSVYYENDTRFRGSDNTGRSVGLSKFRNTLQVEADKALGGGWQLRGILRGTYDGVYQLNETRYGDKAGGAVVLENRAASAPALPVPVPGATVGQQLAFLDTVVLGNPATQLNNSSVAWGAGVNNTLADILFAPNVTAFGFNSTNPNAANYNPNQGLVVLGQDWHDVNTGGVEFGVPVRPCDVDKRGCVDFGGYGDLTKRELASQEFNKKLDFLRELYVRNTFKLQDGTDLFVKIGRQQIVWGRTDLFRVLDVFNPVDYSRNNIYDELQDIRIPLWSLQTEWRMGGSELMQDRNIQFVWSFDQFRANNLGQCGTPNSALGAGCLFRGLKNLWDNGGTVSNFAANGVAATDFGPHQLGIRDVHLPAWKDSGTYGLKYEGVTMDGLAFSLNALSYRSQLPSLRAFNAGGGLTNPFTSTPGVASHMIAFDMYFPRINMIGGSMDFQLDAAKTAVRVEAAITSGEEFANTARKPLYSKNRVFRSVIGLDRPTFIPFISETSATLISAQLFYQHIFDHEESNGLLGKVGMPDWQDNFVGTLLFRGTLNNDRMHPQLILARDFQARAWVASPQVDWNMGDNLILTVGANVKGRDSDNNQRWRWDDCRSCAPYAGFTNTFFPGQQVGESAGLAGLEPLGAFRAGPIGAAWKQNELYMTVKYKF